MANSGNWFATGSTKGVVALYDLRSLSSALATFRRNGAGVEDLCFLDEGLGLAVATSDGLPFVAGLSDGGSDVKVAAELAGVDCDSVRSVRARARHVWCASDDGVVRKVAFVKYKTGIKCICTLIHMILINSVPDWQLYISLITMPHSTGTMGRQCILHP